MEFVLIDVLRELLMLAFHCLELFLSMDYSLASLLGDSDYDNWIDSDEEPLIEHDSDWSEHTDSDSDVSLCGSEHTTDWWEAIRA